jgi:hypothetical protein
MPTLGNWSTFEVTHEVRMHLGVSIGDRFTWSEGLIATTPFRVCVKRVAFAEHEGSPVGFGCVEILIGRSWRCGL